MIQEEQKKFQGGSFPLPAPMSLKITGSGANITAFVPANTY